VRVCAHVCPCASVHVRVCMCACACVPCVCVYVSAHVHVGVRAVPVCVRMCAVCVCVYVSAHVHVGVRAVPVCVRMCAHVCAHVLVCSMCVCACMPVGVPASRPTRTCGSCTLRAVLPRATKLASESALFQVHLQKNQSRQLLSTDSQAPDNEHGVNGKYYKCMGPVKCFNYSHGCQRSRDHL